jgi:hypothetical protein
MGSLGKYFVIFVFLIAPAIASGQSLYQYAVVDSKGSRKSFSSFKGKKLMFMVLQTNRSKAFYSDLVKLDGSRKDFNVVLLDLSRQKDSSGNSQSLSGNLLIIPIGNVRSSQSDLIDWLTKRRLNGHFDIEKLADGDMFFCDGKGELYAFVPGKVGVDNPMVSKLIRR